MAYTGTRLLRMPGEPFEIWGKNMSKKIVGVPVLGKGRTTVLIIGFFLVFFLSCDYAVFSTSSVSIIGDIGGENLYSFLFSLNGITMTTTTLLSGKLIEKLGRMNIMMFGLSLWCVALGLSGAAWNITILLVCRAISGIGTGFSITAAMIMINELFGDKTGYGYLITLLGYGAGNAGMPMIIAWFITHFSWRGGFWVMAATAAAALILIRAVLPNYRIEQETSKLDIKGIITFAGAFCIIVAILSFGGTYISWTSPIMVALIMVAVIALVLFVINEKKIDQSIAIFPVSMLKSGLVIGCMVGQFCLSLNSTTLYAYVPYYMQLEMNATPAQAGLSSSLMSIITTIVGALLLIIMVKAQRHSVFALLTCIGESIAVCLLAVFISPALSFAILYGFVILYGVSQSVETYAFTMTVQSGLTAGKIAIGTAIISFVRAFTGVAATAIASPIIDRSVSAGGSVGTGIKTVLIFVAVLTVAGTIVYALLVMGRRKPDSGIK